MFFFPIALLLALVLVHSPSAHAQISVPPASCSIEFVSPAAGFVLDDRSDVASRLKVKISLPCGQIEPDSLQVFQNGKIWKRPLGRTLKIETDQGHSCSLILPQSPTSSGLDEGMVSLEARYPCSRNVTASETITIETRYSYPRLEIQSGGKIIAWQRKGIPGDVRKIRGERKRLASQAVANGEIPLDPSSFSNGANPPATLGMGDLTMRTYQYIPFCYDGTESGSFELNRDHAQTLRQRFEDRLDLAIEGYFEATFHSHGFRGVVHENLGASVAGFEIHSTLPDGLACDAPLAFPWQDLPYDVIIDSAHIDEIGVYMNHDHWVNYGMHIKAFLVEEISNYPNARALALSDKGIMIIEDNSNFGMFKAIVHEIGHLLGLAHDSEDSSNFIYPYINGTSPNMLPSQALVMVANLGGPSNYEARYGATFLNFDTSGEANGDCGDGYVDAREERWDLNFLALDNIHCIASGPPSDQNVGVVSIARAGLGCHFCFIPTRIPVIAKCEETATCSETQDQTTGNNNPPGGGPHPPDEVNPSLNCELHTPQPVSGGNNGGTTFACPAQAQCPTWNTSFGLVHGTCKPAGNRCMCFPPEIEIPPAVGTIPPEGGIESILLEP